MYGSIPELFWMAMLASVAVASAPVGRPSIDAERSPTHAVFDRWTVERGLPSDSVRAVARTPDGYLWVGTSAGLSRFDGVRFTPPDCELNAGSRGCDVWAVLADGGGELWVGTDEGLVRRERDGASRGYSTADGLPAKHVTCLDEGPDGAIWAGTLGGGLARFRGGKIDAFGSADDGLSNRNVWAVHADAEGSVWVGTVDGLFVGVGGRFVRIGREAGLPSTFVTAIAPDVAGGLWVGTIAGLARLDGRRVTAVVGRADGLPGDRVKCLATDPAGGVWVGFMSGGGAARVREGRVEPLTSADGLPPGGVYALLPDGEDGVWVGTTGGGLGRMRDGRLIPYTQRHGLPGPAARVIAEAPDGAIWALTEGGIARSTPGGRFEAFRASGLPASPEAIAVTRAGVVWVGGGNALARLVGGRVEAFELDRPADRRDRPNIVSQVVEDAGGTLWVGSGSGLQRFVGGRLAALTAADGLADSHVRCLCESPSGTLWVGTRGGLNRVTGGRVDRPDLGGQESVEVLALHAGADGVVWAGTKGGLLRIDRGHAVRLTRREGLIDDEVRTVTTDRSGAAWIGGPRGWTRIGPESIRRLLAGESAAASVRSFGVDDGMPHAACAGGFFHPASLAGRDGSVWLATDGGLARAIPGRLSRAYSPPPTIVEEVAVDGVIARAPAGLIRVPPGARRLDLRFAVLGLRSPARVRSQYRLVGFDPAWVDGGAGRSASYTNLSPGDYEFVVRAADEPGAWGAEGRVALRQLPAFRQTWAFVAACILGASGLVAALAAWRARLARGRSRLVRAERERVARELHDTVIQGVGAAAWTLDAVASGLPDEVARSAVAEAARRVRAGLTDCRHAVWELRAAGLDDLGGALRDAARDLIGGDDVRLEVASSGEHRDLPPAVALALVRIGREAVANALRHAEPTAIRIDLEYARHATRLAVTDDGRGFDPSAVGCGPLGGSVGLVGARERAADAGLAIEVVSRPGAGCRVAAEYRRSRGRRRGPVGRGPR